MSQQNRKYQETYWTGQMSERVAEKTEMILQSVSRNPIRTIQNIGHEHFRAHASVCWVAWVGTLWKGSSGLGAITLTACIWHLIFAQVLIQLNTLYINPHGDVRLFKVMAVTPPWSLVAGWQNDFHCRMILGNSLRWVFLQNFPLNGIIISCLDFFSDWKLLIRSGDFYVPRPMLIKSPLGRTSLGGGAIKTVKVWWVNPGKYFWCEQHAQKQSFWNTQYSSSSQAM